MSSLEGFLTDIRAGNLDVCGPLADFLDDQGLHAKSKRLRARWRRWQTQIKQAQEDMVFLDRYMRSHLDRAKVWAQSQRGVVSYQFVITADTSHEDALLVAYTERLLAEPD